MQKAARAGGIDQEVRADGEFFVSAPASNPNFQVGFGDALQVDLVEIRNADLLHLLNEKTIDVGAIPVRVGDRVVRAGGDEELAQVLRVWRGWRAETVVIKREAALESAG